MRYHAQQGTRTAQSDTLSGWLANQWRSVIKFMGSYIWVYTRLAAPHINPNERDSAGLWNIGC